ncbi:hypothetical protein AAUPMB_00905, partial [Pasteurella multocida subsp. multocida str. Anand1_buffalo]
VLQTPKDMGILTQIVQQQTELALDFIRTESNRHRLQQQSAQSIDTLAAYQKQKGGIVYMLVLKSNLTLSGN